MASKLAPLLSELHAHTTWSDGSLTVRELCDLYGRAGFDVLAVTDHTLPGCHVQEACFDAYFDEVAAEGERARRLYDLLVIPGLELTHEDPDPTLAGHALALGLERFVGVEDGLEPALRGARAHGAALVPAHPYRLPEARRSIRRTAAFATDPSRWGPLVDRFELFNRHTLFDWVAKAGLPAVACGDFHVPEHLATWKTLIPCSKDAAAVIDYLRSPRPGVSRPARRTAGRAQASGLSCRYRNHELPVRTKRRPPRRGSRAARGRPARVDRLVPLREG